MSDRKRPRNGPKGNNGNGTAELVRERIELQADGKGKSEPTVEEVVVVAQAATNAAAIEPTTTATPPAPPKEEHMDPDAPTPAAHEPEPQKQPEPADPIAEMLRQATGAVKFGRSQLTPPRSNSKWKSRAERFEIAADLMKAVDEVQGWVEIVPALIDERGNMEAEQFDASIAAFERAFGRLQGVLDELSVRRCEANVSAITQAIGILEGPKWKGPTADLTGAKKVLRDLERVVRTRRPWPRVNEIGDEAARTLWDLIEGRCRTCGSQLPRDFRGNFCDTCHSAHLAEQRQQEQKVAADDSDLLARLRQQMKEKKS